MSYGEKPPAKKTPNPPGFQPRPPKAKASGSKPPRPARPGAVKPSMPTLNKPDFSNMMPMKATPSAGGSTSTTKKVKSFMKKYGQA